MSDYGRPSKAAVRKAVEKGDIRAVKLALTPRQRKFCEEYNLDFNATAAAIRAGYSPKYADRQAHLLMLNEGVAMYIDDLARSKEAKVVSVDPDYIIQRITAIVNKEGARDGDKLRGLELLARHLGMFIERTEISGRDGEAIQIEKREIQQEAEAFRNLMEQLRERAEHENEKESDPKDVFIGGPNGPK
jgi:phage terminase small subunit